MIETPVNTQTAGSASKKAPSSLLRVGFRRTAPLLVVLSAVGCHPDDGPLAPPADPAGPVVGHAGTIAPAALRACSWPVGDWAWSWTSGGDRGAARLRTITADAGTRWFWSFTPEPPAKQPVDLVPGDTERWLAQRWDRRPGPGPVPLPRVAVASGHYEDLVGLLRALTTIRFGAVVTGWTADPDGDHRAGPPIPVAVGTAVAGAVDLSVCLRRAMAVWNAGAVPPWFVEAPDAAWGVRLVHYPGRQLRPPLYAQATRLDAAGRPARINLYAGDNYADPGDSVYALRGFVHELGHALLLWGHSADRSHTLWGRASPLVSAPSADERKAARLWHGLPEGVDLRNYRVVTPPAASREPWPPGGRP